jgi:hypothetical protein
LRDSFFPRTEGTIVSSPPAVSSDGKPPPPKTAFGVLPGAYVAFIRAAAIDPVLLESDSHHIRRRVPYSSRNPATNAGVGRDALQELVAEALRGDQGLRRASPHGIPEITLVEAGLSNDDYEPGPRLTLDIGERVDGLVRWSPFRHAASEVLDRQDLAGSRPIPGAADHAGGLEITKLEA